MRQTCLNAVHGLARRDPRVVFVGSDLGPDVLSGMRAEFPNRFFMEGIAEALVVGMAAGLAMDGFIPYVNTIATFMTRRCHEQVAIDLCLHDLPVRLIGNGGGLVYAPLGPTHLAIDDIALMRVLPNMCVVAPADALEMGRFMAASLDWPHPIYIRLAKGGDPVVTEAFKSEPFAIGRGWPLRRATAAAGTRILLVTTGIGAGIGLAVADLVGQGRCGVLHLPTIKPIDDSLLADLARGCQIVATIEEHAMVGGLGDAVALSLQQTLGLAAPPLRRFGLPDRFPSGYGSQDALLQAAGLTPDRISDDLLAMTRSAPRPAV